MKASPFVLKFTSSTSIELVLPFNLGIILKRLHKYFMNKFKKEKKNNMSKPHELQSFKHLAHTKGENRQAQRWLLLVHLSAE